ncbi:hypothetical protein DUF815 [Gottschalkia acidurici 9a]|uniref:AAA+ ATPase domain-containing protein n=1 Tax=Gottschalkia acidurici (strain ATCC 7906 / DSM 604 / BCRC 14475 / CIP 104303 / KCTC 5404 / NCIMB 10678 / 9a) TaxID=1128398 RepID=K0B1R5_GOTA9|nr:ATP-binding protein [Gottschalkia acidurici]AFS78880.1 hypothetical protein DUF815 [Gottschalkia acidurici 9a]
MNGMYLSRSYEVTKLKLILDNISIYRNLLNDEVIKKLSELLECLNSAKMDLGEFVNKYNDFFFELGSKPILSLKDYIIDKIIFDENPFSLRIESKDLSQSKVFIENAVKSDLDHLMLAGEVNSRVIKSYAIEHFNESEFETKVIKNLPEWQVGSNHNYDNCSEHLKSIRNTFAKSDQWSNCFKELSEFYKKYGCGMFSKFRAFTWERLSNSSSLRGIDNPDPIILSDLIGYELEREIIVENTLQFINSFPANNMLLYGDRGTGKSSTVKALLNEYYDKGLRIIEIPKEYLADFPDVIRLLKGKPHKFIIFIDDLTFEDGEVGYASLKAVLEGSLESKPKNVLIYATSNRRHLVKEYFHERQGLQSGNRYEEVHASDSIQEKLSLADRFGITVVFSAPSQNEYLEIVEGIVENRSLKIDKEELHREALKWEKRHNGRSARTARQFVDWLEGQIGMNK